MRWNKDTWCHLLNHTLTKDINCHLILKKSSDWSYSIQRLFSCSLNVPDVSQRPKNKELKKWNKNLAPEKIFMFRKVQPCSSGWEGISTEKNLWELNEVSICGSTSEIFHNLWTVLATQENSIPTFNPWTLLFNWNVNIVLHSSLQNTFIILEDSTKLNLKKEFCF